MSKLLKERREELGKELKAIAEVTRIKSSYLKSIEEEEFEKLPVQVYTRGYIKEYAEFLGIPADIALEPYEKYLPQNKVGKVKETYYEKPVATFTREAAEGADSFKIGDELEDIDTLFLSESTPRRLSKTLFFKMLWILLAIALASGIYFFSSAIKKAPPVARDNGQTVPATLTSPPPASWNLQPPVQLPKPAIKDTHNHEMNEERSVPKDKKEALSSNQENLKVQGEEGAAAKKEHLLNIIATDKVWIRVVIDGTESKQMLLNKGDRVSYGANESLVLTVGNAAGAKIIFDGKSFEDLGAKGEVVRFNSLNSAFQHFSAEQNKSEKNFQLPSEALPSPQSPDPYQR